MRMLRALRTSLLRLCREKNGASALEFALIAPIFVLLTLATIETSVIYIAGSSLQVATDRAARLVRTGQAQGAGMSQTQFRQSLCSNLAPIVPCNSNLQIDVQTYTNYNAANYGNPLTSSGNLDPALSRWSP